MDNRLTDRQLTRRLWAGTTIITALTAHCATLLMSIQPTPKAQWNEQETNGLLDYLVTNKAQGEGAGNFKDTTFNGAAAAIALLLSAGPTKTMKHWKTKWAGVCHILLLWAGFSSSSNF